MAKPLEDYDRKRDFARTPEPPPAPIVAGDEQQFVVHRHEASSLHYDLRIELNGVLLSWAVPKGFSFDPSDKRLAVRTENHPMKYVDFHGVIPKGQYGAGTMTIWDRGTLRARCAWPGVARRAFAAMEKGEVKLVLRGRRLRGEWHLVRTNQGRPQPRGSCSRSATRYAGHEAGLGARPGPRGGPAARDPRTREAHGGRLHPRPLRRPGLDVRDGVHGPAPARGPRGRRGEAARATPGGRPGRGGPAGRGGRSARSWTASSSPWTTAGVRAPSCSRSG